MIMNKFQALVGHDQSVGCLRDSGCEATAASKLNYFAMKVFWCQFNQRLHSNKPFVLTNCKCFDRVSRWKLTQCIDKTMKCHTTSPTLAFLAVQTSYKVQTSRCLGDNRYCSSPWLLYAEDATQHTTLRIIRRKVHDRRTAWINI